MPNDEPPSAEWIADCMEFRGCVLTGRYAHWCNDYDGLPVDETTYEWPCICAKDLIAERGKDDTPPRRPLPSQER
jgi:hypothetical protein